VGEPIMDPEHETPEQAAFREHAVQKANQLYAQAGNGTVRAKGAPGRHADTARQPSASMFSDKLPCKSPGLGRSSAVRRPPMTRRLLITASILALTAGCSSSSSNSFGGDSGTTTENDSSAPNDTGVASDDGGTTDTGITTNHDSGTTPTGDSSIPTGDAGVCAAATSVSGLPAYTSVSHQSVCTTQDVSDAVAACFGSTGSPAKCTTWQTANAACAACAVPPNTADGGSPPPTGAIFCVDAVGECFVNTAGCIQVKDGNSTCASTIQELNLCELTACDSPSCVTALQSNDPTGSFAACQTAADQIACSSQLTAATAGCTGNDIADGGSLQYCQASTATDVIRVIYEICGNGQ
jgi:hypothetical protein